MAAKQGIFDPAGLMIGEGYITVGAFGDVAATTTGDEGTMSSAVDEEDTLMSIGLHLAQCLLEWKAKDTPISSF